MIARAAALAALAAAAPLCWDDARPLFWVHAPKTGSSLQRHLADYACPARRRRAASEPNGHERAKSARLSRCARACAADDRVACARPFHHESFARRDRAARRVVATPRPRVLV